jgi:hypothetical protein
MTIASFRKAIMDNERGWASIHNTATMNQATIADRTRKFLADYEGDDESGYNRKVADSVEGDKPLKMSPYYKGITEEIEDIIFESGIHPDRKVPYHQVVGSAEHKRIVKRIEDAVDARLITPEEAYNIFSKNSIPITDEQSVGATEGKDKSWWQIWR